MSYYNSCSRAEAFDEAAIEKEDQWQQFDEDWWLNDLDELTDWAEAYEQRIQKQSAEAVSDRAPFPELLEAANIVSPVTPEYGCRQVA